MVRRTLILTATVLLLHYAPTVQNQTQTIVDVPAEPQLHTLFECDSNLTVLTLTLEPVNGLNVTSVTYKAKTGNGYCEFDPNTPNRCHMDHLTSEVLNFTIYQGNLFENRSVNQTDCVTPPPVVDVRVDNVTDSSATISWRNADAVDDGLLDKNVTYRLNYTSPVGSVRIDNITQTNYTLTGLPFGNAEYRVLVQTKMISAPSIEKRWSHPAEKKFNTTSRAPETPVSPPGAFYVHDNQRLTVYWDDLEPFRRHASSVWHYVNGQNSTSNFSHTLSDWQPEIDNNVTIVRESAAGKSQPLQIRIPARRCPRPKNLRKVLDDDNREFRFSWSPTDGAKSYTVFWCVSSPEDSCKGAVKHRQVTETYFVRNSSEQLNFAVSANCLNGSFSGMEWSKCTTHANGTARLHPIWLNHDTLQWEPICSYRVNISYCVQPCDQPNNITIDEPTQRQYTFTNLDPQLDYTIVVSGSTDDVTNVSVDRPPRPNNVLEYIAIIAIAIVAILAYAFRRSIKCWHSIKDIDVFVPDLQSTIRLLNDEENLQEPNTPLGV